MRIDNRFSHRSRERMAVDLVSLQCEVMWTQHDAGLVWIACPSCGQHVAQSSIRDNLCAGCWQDLTVSYRETVTRMRNSGGRTGVRRGRRGGLR